MKENQQDDIASYFDDKSLIEDDYYCAIQNLIKCKYCQKVLNEPMICIKCQSGFCKNCIDGLNTENHPCENPEYKKNINAISLLGKLKYLCKNCKAEVKKEDIENHIKEGCVKNENSDKLVDSLFRKQVLRKLTQDEVKSLTEHKTKMNHLSGK